MTAMAPLRWRKLGRIFTTAGDRPWNRSHAQVPTALLMNERIRVFYSTRDTANRTSTSFFDVAAADPTRVLHVHDAPVLEPGPPGAFDDCGAMASAIVRAGDRAYLYYIGWNVRATVPFHNSIGLAVGGPDAANFVRFSAGPLLDRSADDPYFCTTPEVRQDAAGAWVMWYASGTEWRDIGGRMEPLYAIKHATSADGIEWRRSGGMAIDFASANEGGLVRPAVVAAADGHRMWYSRRSWRDYRGGAASAYRIGYAESADGVRWSRRDDDAGITVGVNGWDADMIEYPNVVATGSRLYLFYNGNDFGRTGIGAAVAE